MRVLFILAMLCGVIVLGAASAYLYFSVLSGWNAGDHLSLRALWLPTLLLLGAGACGAGMFMKPQEFKEAMQPVEEEAPRPAWLDQLGTTERRDE